MLNILAIIGLAVIDFFYLASTVPDRLMRIIGRTMIFICSLELLTIVLVQYGLPISTNSIALLSVFHFYIALITAIMSSLLFYLSEEYEIGDYEDSEVCDDEENPEVYYYHDLVAVNNDGTKGREQQQQKQKQHTLLNIQYNKIRFVVHHLKHKACSIQYAVLSCRL